MTRATSLVLALASLLGGCVTTSGRVSGLDPVCTALVGPLRYNSTDAKSRRHAGPDLALDLHKRNQVGSNLGCKTFR